MIGERPQRLADGDAKSRGFVGGAGRVGSCREETIARDDRAKTKRRGGGLLGGGAHGEQSREGRGSGFVRGPRRVARLGVQAQPSRRLLDGDPEQGTLPRAFHLVRHVQRDAGPTRRGGFVGSVRVLGRYGDGFDSRGGGGGGAERDAVQKRPGGDVRTFGHVDVVQEASLAHDGHAAHVAVRDQRPRAHAHAAPERGREKARARGGGSTAAPHPVRADAPPAGHPRHAPGVPRAQRDAAGRRGKRREHVLIARAVLQKLGHRAHVHETTREQRKHEKRPTAKRASQRRASRSQTTRGRLVRGSGGGGGSVGGGGGGGGGGALTRTVPNPVAVRPVPSIPSRIRPTGASRQAGDVVDPP